MPDRLSDNSNIVANHKLALRLISSARTMVLATCQADAPWTAPVYYAYNAGQFCFFSSPEAKHIEQAVNNRAAASIFFESHKWEEIQGLQMTGRIVKIIKKTAVIKSTSLYLIKFPFAALFLKASKSALNSASNLAEKAGLFAFVPDKIYYLNNSAGFGTRQLIKLI